MTEIQEFCRVFFCVALMLWLARNKKIGTPMKMWKKTTFWTCAILLLTYAVLHLDLGNYLYSTIIAGIVGSGMIVLWQNSKPRIKTQCSEVEHWHDDTTTAALDHLATRIDSEEGVLVDSSQN